MMGDNLKMFVFKLAAAAAAAGDQEVTSRALRRSIG